MKTLINNKYLLCKSKAEDIEHVIANCQRMSARYCPPVRHDAVDRKKTGTKLVDRKEIYTLLGYLFTLFDTNMVITMQKDIDMCAPFIRS